MISPAMLGTADDGKRIVLYPLELSLRDLFAMAAMQAFCGYHDKEGKSTIGEYEYIAEAAYVTADAMLAERAK